jgi:peptidylprolyl isomerase
VARAAKRQRQKENARAAREAREAALRRRRMRRNVIVGVIFAALIVAVAALFATLGNNNDKNKSTSKSGSTTTAASVSTTTAAALADAKGKPCVAMKGTPPAGAPTVPVQVGPAPTKLIIKDVKVGTGAVAKASDTVTANYIGVACSTGVIFDSSWAHGGKPISFPLSGVIKGWTNGIPGMKVGGTRLLGIPADQAYGAAGSPPSIAPNEALWFVVELTATKAA